MSIADKLLQVNQVKQDIKAAIETKGIPMTNVAFTEYANKILEISGGGSGGGDFPTISYDEIEHFGLSYYVFSQSGVIEQIPQAWQDMKDSENVLFDIPLALAAPNQEMGGMTLDLYVGTDGQLQALYDACENGTIPSPIDIDTTDTYYVNNVATYYGGDTSGDVGFPIPLYRFGNFTGDDDISFLIGDLTPLQMGLGLVLAKIAGVSIPNDNIVIQQGFEFEKENGIIIPNSVTSIGGSAFYNWTSNNQPLVIPNSVIEIGNYAFSYWTSNNQPLVIPNSITSIGVAGFSDWTSNNQPLVIPNSVTNIGAGAFRDWTSNNQPLTIPDSITSIGVAGFSYWTSNNQPLVIPNSITSIGVAGFSDWTSNNQPLVIPNSVTNIGAGAFEGWSSAKEFIMESKTPPTITQTSFYNTNNAPIYVPDESVDDYKTATNWVDLADRIFPISSKE